MKATLSRRPAAAIRAAAALLCVGGALAAGPARAGQPRAHDSGFFLRMSLGGAGAQTQIESGPDKLEYSGGAVEGNFAIGGIVSRNLALHATLFGWSLEDPDGEYNGSDFATNGSLSLGAVGAGVTYYLEPSNFYLSGSLGLAQLSAEDQYGNDAESDAGAAIDLTVGKEWWVGRRWGLGLAGGVNLHSVPDGNLDEDWSGASIGLRFSATFN